MNNKNTLKNLQNKTPETTIPKKINNSNVLSVFLNNVITNKPETKLNDTKIILPVAKLPETLTSKLELSENLQENHKLELEKMITRHSKITRTVIPKVNDKVMSNSVHKKISVAEIAAPAVYKKRVAHRPIPLKVDVKEILTQVTENVVNNQDNSKDSVNEFLIKDVKLEMDRNSQKTDINKNSTKICISNNLVFNKEVSNNSIDSSIQNVIPNELSYPPFLCPKNTPSNHRTTSSSLEVNTPAVSSLYIENTLSTDTTELRNGDIIRPNHTTVELTPTVLDNNSDSNPIKSDLIESVKRLTHTIDVNSSVSHLDDFCYTASDEDNYHITKLKPNISILSYMLKLYDPKQKRKYVQHYIPNADQIKRNEATNVKISEIIGKYLTIVTTNATHLEEKMCELQILKLKHHTITIIDCLLNFMDNSKYLRPICETNAIDNKVVTKLANFIIYLPNVDNIPATQYTLKCIVYKLFKLDSHLQIEVILFYSELYIILCYWSNCLWRLKTFIYDALYCLGNKALPIVYQCLNFEPGLLSITSSGEDENIVDVTLKHVISIHQYDYKKSAPIYQVYQLKALIKNHYIYESNTSDELLNKILLLARNSPNIDVYWASILLAKKESTHWTMNKMINQGFFHLLQNSYNSIKNVLKVQNQNECGVISIADKPTKEEQTVVTVINILGAICRTFNEVNMDKVSCVIFNLKTLLNDEAVTPIIEEAIIEAFIKTSRHNFDLVAEHVIQWKPRAITSQSILKKLMHFMYLRSKIYWTKMCKEISV